MLHMPKRDQRTPSVAIFCFIPDYGHLQPLLKIADALQESGFQIKCYIADECRPLLQRFQFDFYALKSTEQLKRGREMRRAFGRSTFFNSVCLYLHYLLMYPRVAAEVGNSAMHLNRELMQQRPDIIICDALWFTDWYARIAETVGANLIVNSFDGSLAYNQRPFVQTYGVSKVPQSLQAAVEIISSLSTRLCALYYRGRYFRTWLALRAVKRTARAQFEAAFPPQKAAGKRPGEWLVVGTARTERERLGAVLRLKGADRAEVPALRFRSSVPVPSDLLNWIESRDQTVVYVSFGSAVDLDSNFVSAIYEGLRRLDVRVLWSLPESQRAALARIPEADNIRIERFVPQPEILAHPKVRCFVTQGGPHSVQEALFGATPMLCIPFFVDQAYNSSIVERLGAGIRLWRRNVSAESVSSAINEILRNSDYLATAKELSNEFTAEEGGPAIAEFVRERLPLSSTYQAASAGIAPSMKLERQ